MSDTFPRSSATPASEPSALPRWDLDSHFPGVDSPEIVAAIDRLVAGIDAIATLVSNLSEDGEVGSRFDAIVTALDAAIDQYGQILAYLYGKVSADTTDDRAQARMSAFEERTIGLRQVRTRLESWIGTTDDTTISAGSTLGGAYRYLIATARERAAHQLSPAEEDLLAQLGPSSGSAWARLHQDVSAQISVTLDGDDEYAGQPMPMSALRNLAFNPDRSVRERAYRAELDAWQRHATPLAAAMNGIKGQVGIVARLRGYETPLDQALADNHLDRVTLTALVDAAESAFPAFRRYLKAKARLLGLEQLAWFDLFAPVGEAASPAARDRWSFPASLTFIERHFESYSGSLGDLARRSPAERRVDAGARAGKVAGAYCMPFGREQSRILANFTPSYGGMATLAHELGHAYHNFTQRSEPGLRRGSPMVVAETASTFCETLIRHAGLAEASEADRIVILEAFLTDSTQLVLDILSRFRFEQKVFEQRNDHQLSAEELSNLMLEAQHSTYGDGLAADARHPFAWASKSHYYSADRSFYNYPYLFGSLFGIGLFATYRAEPEGFPARYDELLRRTGQASPAELAAEFGVDIRDRAFWARSLASLESDIDQFVSLVDRQDAAS